MTFQQLQYLLEIYRSNSIRKAAENLFVTPSSTSACLSNLEEELGFPIFIRNQKGLIPTQQGRAILDYAQRICDIYDQMVNVQNNNSHTIRISSMHYPPARAAFTRLVEQNAHRGDLVFSWITHSLDSTIRRLLSTELDVGLVTYLSSNFRMLESRLEEAGLAWRILKELPYCICVGQTHPLHRRTSISPRELENELLIDSAGKVYSTSLMRTYMKFTPDRVLATDDPAVQKELICRGLGYAIKVMPPQSEIIKDTLHYIPIEGIHAKLVAITNPKNPPLELIDQYIKLLEEEFGKD